MSAPGAAVAPTLATFRSGPRSSAGEEVASLDTLLDLQVTLAMEVGRATLTVRKLLQLTAGSVLELEREVGEPFDVLVNDTLLARGEAVVMNERCGVRLTEVVQPNERRQFPGR